MAIELREVATETVHRFARDLLELRRRMAKPQRHRLLHGYPLAAAMPTVDPRYRDLVLQNGYSQTTLTNFEREELAGGPRRFIYEEYSFQAERFDMLGFGPSAISFSAADDFHSAWKTLNPELATDYAASVRRSGHAFDRYFHYEQEDLRIFYLTRRLAALRIDRSDYRRVFGSDPADDFEREFAALESERLVTVGRFGIEPTPRGMFFADSIAALLAWRRLRAHRAGGNWRPAIEVRRADQPRGARANDNSFGHM